MHAVVASTNKNLEPAAELQNYGVLKNEERMFVGTWWYLDAFDESNINKTSVCLASK